MSHEDVRRRAESQQLGRSDSGSLATGTKPVVGFRAHSPDHRRHNVSVSAIAAFFALALGCVTLVLGQGGSLESRLWMAALSSVAIGGGCFALVRPLARAEGGPLLARLGPATVVLYTLSFGVFGLAWLAPQKGSAQVIDPGQIPGGMAMSMIGLIALTIGYMAGPLRGVIRGAKRLVSNVFPLGPWSLRVPSIAVLLYLVGTGARLLRLGTGQYGYLQDAAQALSSPSSTGQLLSLLESLTTIALVVAAIDCFMLHRSTTSRIVLIGLLVPEISISLASASKERTLFTILTVALVKVFVGHRTRVVTIVVAAVLVSLLFPFVSDYRQTLNSSRNGQVALTTALEQIPSVLSLTADKATVKSLLIDGPSAVARRVRLVDNVALVRQKTPGAIAYLPWTQLVTGPLVASVPRAVWPSKPTITTGRDFAQDYYELPPSVFSANAVTIPGDLYRHGGLVPLALGMVLLGLLLRSFELSLSPSRDPRHLIIYVPVFLHLIKLENDVTTFAVGLVQLLLFSALTSWLVFARRAPSSLPGTLRSTNNAHRRALARGSR